MGCKRTSSHVSMIMCTDFPLHVPRMKKCSDKLLVIISATCNTCASRAATANSRSLRTMGTRQDSNTQLRYEENERFGRRHRMLIESTQARARTRTKRTLTFAPSKLTTHIIVVTQLPLAHGLQSCLYPTLPHASTYAKRMVIESMATHKRITGRGL